MKYAKFYLYGFCLAILLMWACSPEDYDGPDASLLPKVADIDVSIEVTYNEPVDTLTGEALMSDSALVRFVINNEGVVPIWIFSEYDKVVGNNFERVYTSNGTYEVNLQVYNENGISDGTATYSFVIEGLESEDFLAGDVSKSWVMNYTVPGHISCGEPGSDGTNWWAAGVNEKAGVGLYDDVLTFYADGTFEFDPGEGGTVYVNAGVTTYSEYVVEDGVDYEVPVDGLQASSYEKAGSQLIFPENTIVTYIAFDEILTNPVYEVVELTENKLVLKVDNGIIAWRFEFVPADSDFDVVDPADYATYLAGTWRMASEAYGHLACGEPGSSGLNWWAASPNEKADAGLYDDLLTFTANGDYTFDPGVGGTVYVNVGAGFAEEYNVTGEDYQVPVDIQYASYEIVEENGTYYLDFPENTIVSYIANATEYSESKYRIESFTWNTLELVSDDGNIAWHYIFQRVID